MEEMKVPVSSAGEIRTAIKDAELNVDMIFDLEPDTPLANSTDIWSLLCLEGGGFGVLGNPDLLCSKADALKFLNQKINNLRRSKHLADSAVTALDAAIEEVQHAMEDGGPGVPGGFEPQRYTGPHPYVDVDVEPNDQDSHFYELYTSIIQSLENSPASPASDDEECRSRAEDEQWDLACFNLDYLKLKRLVKATTSSLIEDGITKLENRYLYKRTNLGASSADFSKFKEVAMFPGDDTVD